MNRWVFYEKMFLKNINKDSNLLLISGSEKEIKKLIKSLDPINKNIIIFDYENDLTNINSKNPLIKIIVFFSKIFFFFFKKQQNCLSIFIDKTKSLKRF